MEISGVKFSYTELEQLSIETISKLKRIPEQYKSSVEMIKKMINHEAFENKK